MTKKQSQQQRLEGACSSQPTQEQLDAIGEGVQGLGFWGNAGENDKGEGPAVVLVTRTAEGDLQVFDQSTQEFEFSQPHDPANFNQELTVEPWAHLPVKLGANGGRPSTYRPETFWRIMQKLRIATPLTVAADDHGTNDDRVMEWVKLDQSGTLSREITRARDRGWDKLAMDVLEIADESSNDHVETKDGPRVNNEAIQRSKLRIWARLELLKKWDPRRYGEMLKLTGDRDNPVSLESRTTMSDEQLAQIASKALK